MTTDYYGMKNFGLNYGFVVTAWGIGGVFEPLVGGMIPIRPPEAKRKKLFGFGTVQPATAE